MSRVSSTAVRTLGRMMRAETGLNFATGQIREREQLAPGSLVEARVVESNAAPDLIEKRTGGTYPSVYLFCERIENVMVEKFRTFSGSAMMVAEIRVSQDHLTGIEDELRHHVDAVTQVLDFSRGDWGQGMFYGGGYRIDFEPVKHGGKNYLQTARISFALKVSVN